MIFYVLCLFLIVGFFRQYKIEQFLNKYVTKLRQI
jgi:hypothetical protein